jgi:C4-dicarboxylate-specific signal transduction histidine kinase
LEQSRDWTFDEQNFAGSIAEMKALVIEKNERKKAKDLLHQSDKLTVVGQLATGIAHEIRNPLTSIERNVCCL